MPAVSVVVPTYDRPTIMPRAVRSVLAQTMADLEVVVVDDGPSDAAARAVAEIDDARVRYIRHDRNMGLPSARNTGIAETSGDYVGFLDDDDLWMPDKLALQLPLLEAGASVVNSLMYVADGEGNVYGGVSERGFAIFREVAAAGYPFAELLRRSSFQINCLVVARGALTAIGGFDEELLAIEDIDFALRLRRLYEFHLVDAPLIKYCMHESNTPGLRLAEGWRRLALKELARIAEIEPPDRDSVEAYLQMRLAQSEYVLGHYRAAVGPGLRARRLDQAVVSRKQLAKWVGATIVPSELVNLARRHRRNVRRDGEPDPFIDLGGARS
jgi:glycosyltransferase involved in cell wall biosynthesis